MTNGCGPCRSHGGFCGVQVGAANVWLTGVSTPGNGVNPDGFEIPVVKGINEAPAGFGRKSGWLMFGFKTGLDDVKNLLSEVESAAGTVLGAINCWNRSMAASCSRSRFVEVV